eukprot:8628877-Pyramimonas_sp.AAC.1
MVKAGGSEAFTTRGIDMPDVESLAKPDDADMGASDGEDGAGGIKAEDSQDAAAAEPPSKKAKWFDFDK